MVAANWRKANTALPPNCRAQQHKSDIMPDTNAKGDADPLAMDSNTGKGSTQASKPPCSFVVVSPASTASSLKSQTTYPGIVRMATPEAYAMSTMAGSVLPHWNWKKVAFLHEDSLWGGDTGKDFLRFADTHGVHIVNRGNMSFPTTGFGASTVDGLMKLLDGVDARVVVVVASDTVKRLLFHTIASSKETITRKQGEKGYAWLTLSVSEDAFKDGDGNVDFQTLKGAVGLLSLNEGHDTGAWPGAETYRLLWNKNSARYFCSDTPSDGAMSSKDEMAFKMYEAAIASNKTRSGSGSIGYDSSMLAALESGNITCTMPPGKMTLDSLSELPIRAIESIDAVITIAWAMHNLAVETEKGAMKTGRPLEGDVLPNDATSLERMMLTKGKAANSTDAGGVKGSIDGLGGLDLMLDESGDRKGSLSLLNLQIIFADNMQREGVAPLPAGRGRRDLTLTATRGELVEVGTADIRLLDVSANASGAGLLAMFNLTAGIGARPPMFAGGSTEVPSDSAAS